MTNLTQTRLARPAAIVAAVAAAAALTGLAFALWAENGAGMLVAMIEAGVAWCF